MVKRWRPFLRTLCWSLLAFSPQVHAAELSLSRAAVLVDASEASLVRHTVGELRRQLQGPSGSMPALLYRMEDTADSSPLVIVGRAMTAHFATTNPNAPSITDIEPGQQGFVLKHVYLNKVKRAIFAAGSDAVGTNYALMQ